MAEIVIQKLNPRNRVVGTYTFDTLPITIGRGYDNDLIVADAYICSNHARIDQAESNWRIDDLDSKNGIFIQNRKEAVASSAMLSSGDVIVLGRTYLKVVSPAHPVPESKTIQLPKHKHAKWQIPLLAWCLAMICMAMVLLDFYLDIGDDNLSEELFQATIAVLIVMGMLFVWAMGWSFVGRVLKNKSHFHYHLLTAVCGFVCVELAMYANNFIGYNTCNTSLREFADIMLPVIIIGSVFALSIRAATRMPKLQIHLLCSFVVVLLAAMVVFAQINSRSKFRESPRFDAVLFTPWAKLVHGQTIDQFMQGNERLFRELEQ